MPKDLSVQDGTGVPHLGGAESWSFEKDRHTPTQPLCNIHAAWGNFINLAKDVDSSLEPFRYDLVNTGREILAQLAGPAGQNFTDAIGAAKMDAAKVQATGEYYAEVLNDVDTLVATDSAFLVGPWIEMAKYFGENSSDCVPSSMTDYPTITSCPAFYEWNARVQLTTWNPTGKSAPYHFVSTTRTPTLKVGRARGIVNQREDKHVPPGTPPANPPRITAASLPPTLSPG